MRLIQMSDTHITRHEAFKINPFNQGLKKIQRIKHDYLIHTGDITHYGILQDYEYADELFRGMKKRTKFIPGNHDAKNIGYDIYKDIFGERFFIEENNRVFIIGIDSTIPDLDGGAIGDRTIAFLDREFSGVPDNKIKILALHHHLVPIRNAGRERSMVADAGNLLRVVLNNDINVVLTGHRHSFNVINVGDGKGVTTVINAGTFSCFKTRGREGNTFNVIDINNDNIEVKMVPIIGTAEVTIHKVGSIEEIQPKNKPLLVICQVGDTHFTHGSDFNHQIYDLAIQRINQYNPDLVIHCGDITSESKISSFKKAKKELQKIQAPVLLVPGSRDYYPIGKQTFSKIFNTTEPSYENKIAKVIGIDTCLIEESTGHMGRRRLHVAVEDLKKLEQEKIGIVFFNHHLLPIPDVKYIEGLDDAGEVLSELTSSGVDIILTCGRHIAYTVQVEDTVVCTCGTLSSDKLPTTKGNSFNLIRVYREGVISIDEILIDDKKPFHLGTFNASKIFPKNFL